MKKFVSFLLVAMLVISSFAMTALAADVPAATVKAGSATAKAGDTVSISYSVTGEFDAYQMKLYWDEGLTLTGVSGGVTANNANDGRVAYFNSEGKDVTSHGFTATFKVDDTAAPGSYNVGATVQFVSLNGESAAVSSIGGAITIPVPTCDHKWSEWKEITPGTCKESRTCSVCGATEEQEMTHNPIYDKNETHHWKVCSNCGTKLSDKTPHNLPKDWTDAGDVHTKRCSCGYNVSGEHNHSTIWSTDDTYHWHACAECGNPADKAGHIFDLKQEDDKQWQRCRVCGYETRKIDIGPTGRDEAPDMYDNTPHLVLGFAAILFSVVAMVYGFKRKVSRK